MTVRFLHAADLHLGLRLTRFDKTAAGRIGEARFQALENLQKAAIEHRAQFVVIAGDVFDDNAVSSQDAVRAFEMLEGKRWPGPVFLIPGNHDPLAPGCVWDRDPWKREQPHLRVRLLRERQPVPLPEFGATLYPCPLMQRTSVEDPTEWIGRYSRTADPSVRIGIAHGSLQILPNLPEDDHPIPRDAAERLQLDYLALGHWHKPLREGARTAYPGTHEPMRFPAESAGSSTGWRGYSADGASDRFDDAGRGLAYLVQIDGPGSIPHLEEIEIGRLNWRSERLDVTGRSLGQLIADYSERPAVEHTLMHLSLFGVVKPQAHKRLEALRERIDKRYHLGSHCSFDEVLVEPDAEELRAAVGHGVLPRVLERLQAEAASGDGERQAVAQHALKLLYRLLWEDRPA